jgi:predicted nucleic acid-binding protein
MRIMPDTNVVVSGLLQSQGNPAQVLTLASAGAVQVSHDKHILAEYAEVLARPRFKFDQERVREVLTKLEADSQSVDATGQRDLNLRLSPLPTPRGGDGIKHDCHANAITSPDPS